MSKKEWLSVSMDRSLKRRIQKAAAHHHMSTSRYMRTVLADHMQAVGDWTIPGPKKGKKHT